MCKISAQCNHVFCLLLLFLLFIEKIKPGIERLHYETCISAEITKRILLVCRIGPCDLIGSLLWQVTYH